VKSVKLRHAKTDVREEAWVPDKPIEVLLIEDNREEARLTTSVLKQQHPDIHVELVQDGPSALDFLFSTGRYSNRAPGKTPALILLDMGLPKMSGIAVLKVIKSYTRTRVIPVVVFTSNPDDQLLLESYQLGVNSFVRKPINFEQFRQTIRTIAGYWLGINQDTNSEEQTPSSTSATS
jgi:two-component system, response regulator